MAKGPYRHSNKRKSDIGTFLFRCHEREMLIGLIEETVSKKSSMRETNWRKVICFNGK